MYELFQPQPTPTLFLSFILLCDRQIVLRVWGALSLSRQTRSVSRLSGRRVSRQGEKQPHAASQPCRFIAPLKVGSFLVLGRRGANCSAVRFRTNCQICLGTEKEISAVVIHGLCYMFSIQATLPEQRPCFQLARPRRRASPFSKPDYSSALIGHGEVVLRKILASKMKDTHVRSTPCVPLQHSFFFLSFRFHPGGRERSHGL